MKQKILSQWTVNNYLKITIKFWANSAATLFEGLSLKIRGIFVLELSKKKGFIYYIVTFLFHDFVKFCCIN